MIRKTVSPIAAVLCCVAAAYVSSNLLEKHISGSSGVSWFEAGCSDDDEPGGADCAKVLASPYSYFPAKSTDPEPQNQHNHTRRAPDRTPHVPVAFLGLVYYSGLAVWFIGIGRPSPSKRWLHVLPLAVIVFGLIGSAYYTYIMFTQLDEWCPWCLVTHGLNVCIAGCAFAMTPAAPTPPQHDATAPKGAPEQEVQRSPRTARGDDDMTLRISSGRPSGRLVLITCLAIAFVSYAHLSRLGLKTWRQRALGSTQQVNQAVVDLLVRTWRHADRIEFDIGDDVPVRTHAQPGEFSWDMVVFSDFECPSCRRVAKHLEENVEPLFAGRLRMAYMHYPLHSDCNGRTKTKKHTHACRGAAMAEAARMLGGNSGFWKAHDYMFANQNALTNGSLTSDHVAAHLGVDPAAFMEAMQSPEVAAHIARDVEAAGRAKITGTPSVYLAGRKVEPLARASSAFWEALAKMFWKASGETRPASTLPRGTTSAAANNPD